jgi:Zeta toxin
MEHKKMTRPQFDFVFGGVCSGKSTFIKDTYSSDYKYIDAGDIFIALSDGKLEKGMNKIGEELTVNAVYEKCNVVMEFIGDDETEINKCIDGLKSIGYEVNVQAIDCDFDLAMERNFRRDKNNISAYYTQSYHYKWIEKAILFSNVDKLK